MFLHGFPEIWYTWRHQMIAVANKGYRAIAFDFRGYGLSDQPPEPEKGNFHDLIADVVALLDSLGIDKVNLFYLKLFLSYGHTPCMELSRNSFFFFSYIDFRSNCFPIYTAEQTLNFFGD